MIVAGTADVLVQQAGRLGRVIRLVPAVLQDGGDRGVGARAERQRPGTGRVDPLYAVVLHQAQNADAGAEPLLGMRPRAQDQVRQRRRVVADGGRCSATIWVKAGDDQDARFDRAASRMIVAVDRCCNA